MSQRRCISIKKLRTQTQQSRLESIIESGSNIVVGFTLNFMVLCFIFDLPSSYNISILLAFTVTALIRTYVLRRLFERNRRFLNDKTSSKA